MSSADRDRLNRDYALRSIGRWFIIGLIFVASHYNMFVTALAIAASQTTWRVHEVLVREAAVPHDTVFIKVETMELHK